MVVKIETPCIGVCSTIYGDDICRGCHRTFDEIIKWNDFSVNQRDSVNLRLQSLQAKYLAKIFKIVDFELFTEVLNTNSLLSERYKVLLNQVKTPANEMSLVYKILKKHLKKFTINQNHDKNEFSSRLIVLSDSGIILKNSDNNKFNLNQIISQIDEAIYKESENIFSRV
jgi:Predicted Fe-S protein